MVARVVTKEQDAFLSAADTMASKGRKAKASLRMSDSLYILHYTIFFFHFLRLGEGSVTLSSPPVLEA